VVGMPHALEGTGNERGVAGAMIGPPNGPSALRVSATRHGVNG
jgi:hypothetical protein